MLSFIGCKQSKNNRSALLVWFETLKPSKVRRVSLKRKVENCGNRLATKTSFIDRVRTARHFSIYRRRKPHWNDENNVIGLGTLNCQFWVILVYKTVCGCDLHRLGRVNRFTCGQANLAKLCKVSRARATLESFFSKERPVGSLSVSKKLTARRTKIANYSRSSFDWIKSV